METKQGKPKFELDPNVWVPLAGKKVMIAYSTPELLAALDAANVACCPHRGYVVVHNPTTTAFQYSGPTSLRVMGVEPYVVDKWIDDVEVIEHIVRRVVATERSAATPSPAPSEKEKAVTPVADADVAAVLAMGPWSDHGKYKRIPYVEKIAVACTERCISYTMEVIDEVMHLLIDLKWRKYPSATDAHGIPWVILGWGRKAVATEAVRRIIAQHPDEYAVHAFADPVVYWSTDTKLSELQQFTKNASIFKDEYARGAREEAARNGTPLASSLIERSNFAQIVQQQYVADKTTCVVLAPLADPAQDAAFCAALRDAGGWCAETCFLFGNVHFVKPVDAPWSGNAFWARMVFPLLLLLLNIVGVSVLLICAIGEQSVVGTLCVALALGALDAVAFLGIQLFVARHAKTLIVRS